MKTSSFLLRRLLTRRACHRAALIILAALAFQAHPIQGAVTEAWVHRYNNAAANANDGAVKLVRDAAGDVIVTGSTNADRFQEYRFQDTLTIKFSGMDGSVIWLKRYNGPANGRDDPVAIVVDPGGNVVVAGSSSTPDETSTDYFTAKYAGLDGSLLWERRSDDVGQSIAVDSSGSVVMTGQSSGPDFINTDYYTAKYAAGDGALLWEKHYNGPANGNDYASGLALGPNGIIAVTGTSSDDYATVVYRDLPPPGSFAAWAASHGLTGPSASADADPDKDGLPNSAEFILLANPTVPVTSASPTAITSGSNTVLTFRRDDESETPDVTLTVESGTDLQTWPMVFNIGSSTAASSSGVSITENGAAADTITVTIPHGTAARFFVRMNVTITP